MPSDTLVLGFDTSAAHCAAALLSGTDLIASRQEFMSRGQAERLMPMMEEMLAEAHKTWRDLTVIGVGIGPGNFTGVRISVSAARGLALGLGIPAIGVNSFDALALGGPVGTPILLPAPRGDVYAARPGDTPERLDPAATHDFIAREQTISIDIPGTNGPRYPLAEAIARLALARKDTAQPRPAPLYLRAADAAPPRDPAPLILP